MGEKGHLYQLRSRRERLQSQIIDAISGHLKIRRKTDVAQSALWQVVYHQDFLPVQSTSMKGTSTWRPVEEEQPDDDGWDTTGRVVLL